MSIEISNVNKRFGDFVALEDVNVSLPTGQLTALLGPSGGGKSTLLRIIAGLERADTGSISIEGVDATKMSPRKRNVGFVFQHYAVSFILVLISVLCILVVSLLRPKESTS